MVAMRPAKIRSLTQNRMAAATPSHRGAVEHIAKRPSIIKGGSPARAFLVLFPRITLAKSVCLWQESYISVPFTTVKRPPLLAPPLCCGTETFFILGRYLLNIVPWRHPCMTPWQRTRCSSSGERTGARVFPHSDAPSRRQDHEQTERRDASCRPDHGRSSSAGFRAAHGGDGAIGCGHVDNAAFCGSLVPLAKAHGRE